MAKQRLSKGSTASQQLYFGQFCSVTVQLERLQSSFDGTDQLVKAIYRLIKSWDDVWGDCQVRISNPMVTYDWTKDEESSPSYVGTTVQKSL